MGASPLVLFYREEGTDRRGRRLADILAWDDERLEMVHDYVQWLFPLPEPSGFNPHAPRLSHADQAAFTGDPALRARLLAAFRRMLAFYGLALDDGDPPTVRPDPGRPGRIPAWLRPGDHNLLRVTRILRSLTLLGLRPYAEAFLAALLDAHASGTVPPVNPVTLRYWRDAVVPSAG